MTILLICFFCGDLQMNIENVEVNSTVATFSLSFVNEADNKVIFRRPDLNDVIFQIVKVLLVDQESDEMHFVFKNSMANLTDITLNCNNSIVLYPDERFIQEWEVPLNEFTPRLRPGKYSLLLYYSYEHQFVTLADECEGMLIKTLKTEKVDIAID